MPYNVAIFPHMQAQKNFWQTFKLTRTVLKTPLVVHVWNHQQQVDEFIGSLLDTVIMHVVVVVLIHAGNLNDGGSSNVAGIVVGVLVLILVIIAVVVVVVILAVYL